MEAVLDIDCDLPPGFDLAALEESSRARFEAQYPRFRRQLIQAHEIEARTDAPAKSSTRTAVQSLQFVNDEERQVVQVRAQGFSFNRLAPYTTLDDYLPEIARTWHLYLDLVSPVQIRIIRLRYINRIPLPMKTAGVDLDEFLKIGPRVPDEENLTLSGFLSQQVAVEKGTEHQMNLVLTAQGPDQGKLPLILDITVADMAAKEIIDWPSILTRIASLRSLKNRIFLNSLTPACIGLFQ